MKKQFIPLCLFLMVALSAGCASHKKASLASGRNPQQAVAEVEKVQDMALRDQVDVLVDKTYLQGSEFLQEAKQGLAKGAEPGEILDNAAIAKAYLEDATKIAQGRRLWARRILENRAAALKAGVRDTDELVETLQDIDDDLKSETKQFKQTLSPEDFSELQKRYLALEARAVQVRVLSEAKGAINYARENDAEDLAADSLRTAQLDYEAAMNMIAQSPRSPDVYNKSAETSLASAKLLSEVMNVIQGAKGTPEHIALQIVKQKRALGALSTDVGMLKENLETTKQTLEEKEGKLKQTQTVLETQKEQLARASTQVRFQQAMDEARQILSPEDALVYQQGNQLVFRLKRINFPTGAAEVPDPSKQLIAKVEEIIKKLDAEKVVVQGHTDSVGPSAVNKRLSTERATAVAKFLAAQKGGYKITYYGFGESQPISSNKTKTGRATNRRVDLVVTVKK